MAFLVMWDGAGFFPGHRKCPSIHRLKVSAGEHLFPSLPGCNRSRLSSGSFPSHVPLGGVVAVAGGIVWHRHLHSGHSKRNRRAPAKLPRGPWMSEGSKAASTVEEEPERGVKILGPNRRRARMPMAIANSPVAKVFDSPCWPSAWPYNEADFARGDETQDEEFFKLPRLQPNLDSEAGSALRFFHAELFKLANQGEYSVLDLCSSFESHYPKNLRAKRVALTGMSESELEQNKQATEWTVRNLNEDPSLPFENAEFDFVTMTAGVLYLSRPQEVFAEMHRVLKPGGLASIAFSNRCWPSKAVKVWIDVADDPVGQCQIAGNYFHFSPPGGWQAISALDLRPSTNAGKRQSSFGQSAPSPDPVYAVTALKA